MWDVIASQSTSDVLERATVAARDGGARETHTAHLLVALLDEPVVCDALSDCGISSAQVRSAVDDAAPGLNGRPTDPASYSDEAHSVFDSAARLAFGSEHVKVECGHMLLAIVSDGASEGARVLDSLGVDLDKISQSVASRLPTVVHDADVLRTQAARCPRLSAAEVRMLLTDLVEYQNAVRTLRDAGDDQLPGQPSRLSDQQRALIREHAMKHATWLDLFNHHLYLVVAASKTRAAAGHDFGFAHKVASQALM
ncbi:MAG: Clp protease N-terminal domain-containing protein, partial [Deltaproteobacteria bacterium]|nr:Clp protease N-terminal domain-containing protein [Deltaproteobacteria bacterium]